MDPLSSDDEIEEEGNNEPAELSDREEYAEDVDLKEVVINIFRSWLTSHPGVPSNAEDDLIK